uniref:Ig-like domain-containing protein n=1 Tax=Eptatretus burgeri TaxID=7764 RepID=A0A8C4QPN4_EPTBU
SFRCTPTLSVLCVPAPHLQRPLLPRLYLLRTSSFIPFSSHASFNHPSPTSILLLLLLLLLVLPSLHSPPCNSLRGFTDRLCRRQTRFADLNTNGSTWIPHEAITSPAAPSSSPSSSQHLHRCEIPSTAKQVAWLNRSAILFAKDLRWTQDQRISLERRSPTQYGLRVREVGLRDEGPYTCSLQGQGFPHTATLYLLVQVPPIITEISEDLTIEEGSNVTAFCSATGRPEPAVSWRHLSPSARMEEIEGEVLFLERVSRTQAGEYQCSAANDVTIADTRRLRLTVNYVPSDVEIRSTGMLLGRAGSLRCQASAVPLPWFT